MAKQRYTRTFTVQTTDASTVSPAWTLAMGDTRVWGVSMVVIARDQAGSARALYRRYMLAYREGGGATVQGSVETVGTDIETSAGLNATLGTSGNNIGGTITGLAATTIDWTVLVEVLEAP